MNFSQIARSYLAVDLSEEEEPSMGDYLNLVAKATEFSDTLNYPLGTYYPEKPWLQVDAEVGDDHVCFTQTPHVPVMETTIAQSLMGMEVSMPDTFISKVYCTFTGKVAIAPIDHFDHYSQVKVKKSEGNQTIVVDLPALRSVVNVDSQVKTNTSTLEGRMNYISRSTDHNRGTNEEKLSWTISILQDVTHCVFTQGEKFPYIPSYLGGYDKPLPFNCEENLDRALHAFKRGRYKKLVYTILAQFYRVLYNGDVPSDFLRKIKGLYSGYQSWFCNYRRNFPLFSAKLPPEMWKHHIPQSVASGSMSNMVIRRLSAEGLIVREADLVVAHEVQNYFSSLLSEDLASFRDAKKEIEKKFSAEMRIQQAFAELVQGGFDVILEDQLDPIVKRWAKDIRISDSRMYRNAFIQDQHFWRTGLDEIYLKSPLKVTFPLIGKRWRADQNTKKLDPIENEREFDEPVRQLVNWIKGDFTSFPFPPAELLEDDEILLEKVKMIKDKFLEVGAFPVILLITNDIALCRLINNSMSVPVVRLPPEFVFVVKTGRFGVPKSDEPITFYVKKLLDRVPGISNSLLTIEHDPVILPDFGSWDATAIRFDLYPYKRTVLHKEIRSDQIFEYRTLEKENPIRSFLDRVDSWPNDFIVDNERLIVQKEFSASENWRKKEDRPRFNPFSLFNLKSKKRVRDDPAIIRLLREGAQESIFIATEKEREKLFQFE